MKNTHLSLYESFPKLRLIVSKSSFNFNSCFKTALHFDFYGVAQFSLIDTFFL